MGELQTVEAGRGKSVHRRVDAHLIRHGQQESVHDPESLLAPPGVAQAHAFAGRLFAEYGSGPVTIKILTSSTVRTRETAHAALLQDVAGKRVSELGGSIGHTESLDVSTDAELPRLTFRKKPYNMAL